MLGVIGILSKYYKKENITKRLRIGFGSLILLMLLDRLVLLDVHD